MKHKYIILILLCLMLLPIGAFAQMPVRNPAWVQVNPPFEGMELGYSSATVEAFNYYGNYWWDVLPGVVVGAPHNILSVTHADTLPAVLVVGDVLYVDAGGDLTRLPAGAAGAVLTQGVAIPGWAAAPAAGLWEAGVSYRGGAASLEPVIAQDGIPVLVQDALAAQYVAFIHDATDANYDTSLGSHRFFMTGIGEGLQVHAPGIVPGVNLLRVDLRHSGGGGDSYLESITGDMGIRPANGSNVGVLDSTGGADDYFFPDGDGPAGWILATDGANQLDFINPAALTGGTWFLYDTASADIAGYDTLFADPSVGGVQSYNIAIPASPTLIEEFATEVGEPGITFINDGLIEFHFHARRSAGTMDARVYAEIYTRTLVPVETLIATTELSNELTNAQAAYEVHATVPFTAMAATDRLVVKVYANQIPPGANPTVQFYVEGATATRIELPGAEAGSGMAHIMVPVPVQGAEPTQQILEAGVSEDAMDFFVDVNCHSINTDTVWPALGSRFPVANLITYYWHVDAGNLTVNIVNDSPEDVMAMIWWGR